MYFYYNKVNKTLILVNITTIYEFEKKIKKKVKISLTVLKHRRI